MKRTEEMKKRAAHRAALEKLPFTPEEKTRWAEAMRDTWGAIACDVGDLGCRVTTSLVVELVLDAGRCETYGGMTREEGEFMSAIYNTPSFTRWARKEMRGYAD